MKPGDIFVGRRPPKGRWRKLNPEELDPSKWKWLKIC
jgi:hypothetical protein